MFGEFSIKPDKVQESSDLYTRLATVPKSLIKNKSVTRSEKTHHGYAKGDYRVDVNSLK